MAFSDLAYLQGLVKGDSAGYREEAMKQHKQFLTQYEIFQLKPSKEHKEFSSFIKFLSQVAPCYPDELKSFPSQLAQLLEQNAMILDPKLRETLVRALVLLRNRNLLSPTSLLSLFFKLFRIPDKNLRQLLRTHIVSDIQKCNKKKHNNELNRSLQNFMYGMLKDSNLQASRESLGVMIELWRRNVWSDNKTINVISTGVFSPNSKVIAMTLNFFLQKDERFTKEEDDEEPTNRREIIRKYGAHHIKKTNKTKRILSQKLVEAKKKNQQKLKEETIDEAQYNYAAFMGINDPQSYCEKVFGLLKTCPHGFELKVQLMNFCSRLISTHKLMVDGFYSYLQKHAQPHNKNITQILAILAQSCHPLVSPDVLEPVLQHLANIFVTDRRPVEVIAIGLNTIREMCVRAPLIMPEGLLKDLCSYKRHRDKGIMMSSKSIISLFRTINPGLLPKKERGKDADLTIKPRQFGETVVLKDLGADLLDEFADYDSEDMSEDMCSHSGSMSVEGDVEEGEESGWEEVSAEDDDEAPELVPIGSDEEGEEGEDGFMAFEDSEEEGELDSEGELLYGSYEEGDDSQEMSDEENDEESEENVSESKEQTPTKEVTKKNPQMEKSQPEKSPKIQKPREPTSAEDHTSTDSSRRQRLDTTKILTDEEFEKIKKLKALKAEKDAATHKEKAILKRKFEQAALYNDVETDVDVSDIAGAQKKRKQSYQERVKDILESKEDKTHYSKYNRERKQHSISNEKKAKTKKPFAMSRKNENRKKKKHKEKQKTKTTKNKNRKNKSGKEKQTRVKQKSLEKQRLSQKQRKNKQAKHVKKIKSQAMNRHF